MLLEELYYRTLDILEGEGLDGEDLAEWIFPNQVRGARTGARRVPRGTTGRVHRIRGIPVLPRLLSGIIVEHYVDIRKYLQEREQESLSFSEVIIRKLDHRGPPGFSAVTLTTRDRSGLFFKIAGSLLANRINILSAWSHSMGDLAIGTFHVNDIPEGPLDDPDRWENFCSDLTNVIKGAEDVDKLVAARRQTRSILPTPSTPRFPLKVVIDNAASDRATIVEVNAHDRPGLLYDITRSLSSLELDIILTKITTEGDQAADVFYVREANGQKIVDFDRLDTIKAHLSNHLAAMEEAHFSSGDKKKAV